MGNLVIASILAALIGYLLGSISFAVLLSTLVAKDDVRKHGSGNAGMTNMLRTYGKGLAAFTLIGDISKGIIAVLLARLIFHLLGIDLYDGGYVGGLFAIVGHLFPVYFKFKGGKGILTSLGVVIVLDPIVALILIVLMVPFVFIVRIVSLTSLIAAILFPILTYVVLTLQNKPPVFHTAFASLIAVMAIYMHRENIKRLLKGTEHRFGKKQK